MTGPDVETASADYATRFAGPVGRWFLDVQAAATTRLLADLPRGRLLDVGGGHGQVAPALARAGWHVTVLGSSPEAGAGITDDVARGLVHFDVGPLDPLPYAAESFDVVCSYRTLAHADHWESFLAGLCRVARRAVLVDYASRRSVNVASGALFSAKQKVERNTRPFRLIAPRDIAAVFDAAGFRIGDAVAQFAWPMALHRMVPLWAAKAIEAVPRGVGLTRLIGSPVIVRANRSER